ncbi:MAG: hypothetical protein CV087_01790 [Candidatus Brocadia sp. WS118]|nr:MAG: hypothetical protein CV087_01790 [Candidatus Brocadia sp. WS118]
MFYRDFRQFQGGHLKVWDYFNHVIHSHSYHPKIFFSGRTVWDDTNPWLKLQDQAIQSWDPSSADILFLAGKDWLMLNKSQRKKPPVPIINYIQHVRHSDPNETLYSFLEFKAIRICVSDEVKSAIVKTGKVTGPVFTIPNGIDFQGLPNPIDPSEKKIDIVIAALKQPKLGLQLMQKLHFPGRQIKILATSMLRSDYLNELNQARVTIFLPNHSEGFYLPALEGMALGTLVVCPDCIGNRSFCFDNYNCLRVDYTLENILCAVDTALKLSDHKKNQMITNAYETTNRHSIGKERDAFLKILEDIKQVWERI